MILLTDQFEGSHKGITSQGVTYGTGLTGQAAKYGAGTAYIKYASTWFPSRGTIVVNVKIESLPAINGAIFDSIGSNGATAGDMKLIVESNGTLTFKVFDGSNWHYLYGTTTLVVGKWYAIAASYGASGMKLYVNGVSEGTFYTNGDYSGDRNTSDMYFGDYPLDAVERALSCWIDSLRTSNIESDSALLTSPTTAYRFGTYVFPATIYPTSIPNEMRLPTVEIPRRDGVAIGSPLAKEKVIQFRGMLLADTPELMRLALDGLQAALASGRQPLYLWTDRYIYATKIAFATDYDSSSFKRYCHVSIDFLCDSPFWESEAQGSDTWSSPGSGTTRNIAIGGNAYVLPVFAITVNSGALNIKLARADGRYFTLSNSTGEAGTITVDCAAQTVKNGSGADRTNFFDGAFFDLSGGAIAALTYTKASGTAVASSIVTTWRNRWM